MNIAATANFNYTAASTSASAPTSAPPSGRAAIIAEILSRILQPIANSANSASQEDSGAAIILTQLLSSTKSVGSTNGAALMELNLNQLLNSSVLQKALAQLPSKLLAKPQVIEALVLQNTLLPAVTSKELSALPVLILPTPASSTAPAQSANTLYRINIEWQNKLIQLLSPQPLPTGTRVPLQIDARGVITLLRPEIAAKILLTQNAATNTALTRNPLQPISAQALSLPTLEQTSLKPILAQQPSQPTPVQTIQQSLRELLPRQQALHTLVPLLQKFIAPTVREQLPQSVFKAVAQLLQSLPKPAQLNTAENVKQAINNSGSFLEAKLAQAATATPGAESVPQIASTDIKAQISALLALVRQLAPQAATSKPTAAQASTQFVTEEDFVYAKPAVQNSLHNNSSSNESESLDSLLTQLGKLLQAGFARIQLNQLDSASAHHVSHETQAPVPTWVLELPLRTPHGVDQLQLRIEQQHKQQQQHTRIQWNVEIALDLHAAGKLAASLTIIDKSVSATLWAEHEQTHRRVREEMAYLRAGLESVGVNVTEMQCRLGLPTPRSHPISQQLVDVHT